MANGPDVCAGLRAEFIRLLEGDEEEDWRITQSALNDGRQILPQYRGHFGAYAVNLFIVDQLRANVPMHAVTLGSGETACVMNTQLPDGRSLYIKLKMEDEMAVILSFHVSQHSP
jgi:hypothetical protein